MSASQAALDHMAALAPLYVSHAEPMPLVERGVQPLRNGATVVRLSQESDGVVVHSGEMHLLLHPDQSLAAVSGTLLPELAKQTFTSTADVALGHALDELFGKSRSTPAITVLGDRGGWSDLAVAAAPDIRITKTRARKEIGTFGGEATAMWAVEILGDAPPAAGKDPSMRVPMARRLLVGDADGRILGNINLIQSDAFLYRVYAETNGNRRPLDGALESVAPHPTGIPGTVTPGFSTANLVVQEAFNGPIDPWLPDDATTTAGNNAIAFSDLDGSFDFSDGDSAPEVRSGRILNYIYDPTAEPLSSLNQLAAGAVNSFYMVNWMHDWWYDSGFTEATGNAQLDNLGRGGVDGDPLIVHAQFGALTGQRDNAFMSTPADGLSPDMVMFLWNAGIETRLTGPDGDIPSSGVAAPPHVFDLTGTVAATDDGVSPVNDGCTKINTDLTGKIAISTYLRNCGSAVMVNNAKAAGAIGMIIIDGIGNVSFAGSAAANIPTLAINATDGAALLAAVASGPVEVTLHSGTLGPERDGDIDNTVVGHEWGHYLHHRLAVCEFGQQCNGISEGWADFNALMMMLREGDNRESSYSVGPYATGDGTFDSGYFGIRRFPYSINHAQNDMRFRHISDASPLPTTTPAGPFGFGAPNSEVHNTGEVWAELMWEALNALVDAHDVNVARRRMSDYVVAGLLMTPPEASFVESRDAVLAAASALDTDDMLLMAAAFAGRGLGSCAVAPNNDHIDNTPVVESGTLAAKLSVSAASLSDDRISCDQDGYLDPGEKGTVRVTVANTGIVAAEGVKVTVSSKSAGVVVGAPISVGDLDPFTSKDLAFPITLAANAPANADILLSITLKGDQTCDRAGAVASFKARTAVDEAANAATVDHVETKATAWTTAGDALFSRITRPDFNQVWMGKDAGFITDSQLVSPVLQVNATAPFVVKFAHAFAFEASGATAFDGGVIEFSTDGGATWADVLSLGVNPGYTARLARGGGNPLEGRPAFAGRQTTFSALQPVTMNFGTQLAGKAVQLRFRIGTDAGSGQAGWLIDDIDVSGIDNTPFTAFVSEPEVCKKRSAAADESVVEAASAAPAVSLTSFDNAICILRDSQ